MGGGVMKKAGGGGRRGRRRGSSAAMSEINVTPFVDVMLVLLIIFMVAAPMLTVGVPIELLGLLVAVEAVPDIFRTVGNVSGDMAATQIVAKNQPATIPPEQAAA